MNAPSTPLASPDRSPFRALGLLAKDIKLAHSVFALPFAVLAGLLALPATISALALAGQLALIVVCMFFARSWAMLINRLADRSFDAQNPRTARRALASGEVSAKAGWTIALACALAFIASTGLFLVFFENVWPIALSLPVLVWLALYSYTKRFTALCHLFLGSALAMSPLAAAIAIDPTVFSPLSPQGRSILLLSGFVMCWVAGFDIIYALQDFAFDRGQKLRSIPAWLGPSRALWVSRLLHIAAALLLWLAWNASQKLGMFFAGAASIACALLIVEHTLARSFPKSIQPDRPPPPALNMAFFTLNGAVSLILGVAGGIDCL